MVGKFQETVDAGYENVALFADISKSFSCIDHLSLTPGQKGPIVLTGTTKHRWLKAWLFLEGILLSLINSILSYLETQTQWTKVNNCFSLIL